MLWVGFSFSAFANDQHPSGKSLASPVLQHNVFTAVQFPVQERLRCFDIGITNTTFLHYLDSAGNATQQFEVKGDWVSSSWIEQWVIEGCGRKAELEVRFKPDLDPAKGTTYSVKINE